MIQVGIFSAYFPHALVESARRIRAAGFNTVQLDLHFKDMDLGPGKITKDKCVQIREVFRDHDLPISCISGYTNIIHPDKGERERRVSYLKEQIRAAQYLGTPYLISETGTLNPDSDWDSHPDNKSPEAWDDCRKMIAHLAQHAYDHGAVFLLETYVNNVVGSIEETLRMFAEVNHPGLGLLMDPTNYFDVHNIDKVDATLNAIFDALSDKIRIAHAKDVKPSGGNTTEKHADIGDADALESHTFRGVGGIELPAPGNGILNYDLYLKRLHRTHPNIPIIIEHLDETDVPRAKKFLDGRLRAGGF